MDDEGPRFYVSIIEGYPISPSGETSGKTRPVLVATVIDSFYGSEHGRFSASDNTMVESRFTGRLGREDALAAAA